MARSRSDRRAAPCYGDVLPRRRCGQRGSLVVHGLERFGWNRFPVRIGGGVRHPGRDAAFELLGYRVLQAVGLLMHVLPVVAQELDEETFDQAVVTHHFQREALTFRHEAHALVALIVHQATRVQPLDRHGDRCRRVPHNLGDAAHPNLRARAPSVIDRTQVILIALCQFGSGHQPGLPAIVRGHICQ